MSTVNGVSQLLMPRDDDPLGFHQAGWLSGKVAPSAPGVYERLSAIGVTRDAFDGAQWRRFGGTQKLRHAVEWARTHGGFNGVVCANQHLPWRSES